MEANSTIATAFDLGTWLGRKQAFSLVASRCSAADAECLRDIRENKRYKALDLSWEDFCQQHIGISRSLADGIIRRLEQLGPNYFKLSSFTRISPTEYRRISGAVTEDGVAFGGETIALESENAPQLAEAVDALRREHAPEAAPSNPVEQALAKAEKALKTAMTELQRLSEMPLDIVEASLVQLVLAAGRRELDQLAMVVPSQPSY